MDKEIDEIVVIIGMIFSVLVLLIWGADGLSNASCDNVSKIMDRQSIYKFNGGCFLKADDGHFLPEDSFRQIQDAK